MNDQAKVEVNFIPLKVRGSVKWFSDEKGFGFLMCEGVGVDVFVHKQQLQKSGVEEIKEGDHVQCTVNKGLKGLYATQLALLEK